MGGKLRVQLKKKKYLDQAEHLKHSWDFNTFGCENDPNRKPVQSTNNPQDLQMIFREAY